MVIMRELRKEYPLLTHCFVSGEFVLTHANIRVKSRHTIYSINEGNASLWNEATRRYVHSCKYPAAVAGKTPKPYSLRYVGSMVCTHNRYNKAIDAHTPV